MGLIRANGTPHSWREELRGLNASSHCKCNRHEYFYACKSLIFKQDWSPTGWFRKWMLVNVVKRGKRFNSFSEIESLMRTGSLWKAQRKWLKRLLQHGGILLSVVPEPSLPKGEGAYAVIWDCGFAIRDDVFDVLTRS
jgi:hypothetical protein